MEIVLDNIIFSLQRAGGISAVWANLIGTLLNGSIDFKCLEYGLHKNIYRNQLFVPDKNIIHCSDWGLSYRRYFNPVVDLNNATLFHSSYYRTVNSPLVKNITTIHDFTYEYFVRGPRAWIHRFQKFNAIRKSDHIVCISKNTRNDLLRFLPDVSPSKVSVIHNGVSEDYFHLQSINNDLSDCLMFVGARGGYKNFDFAVEIAAQCRRRLLICGSPLDESEKQFLVSKLGASGYISYIRPSNKELNEYYNSVFALLYPSSYEGFGIPVLEAQKAGCPVIALNASSIPEIIGKDYPMLTRLSVRDAERILSIYANPTNRAEMVLNGINNAMKYSWDKMGKEYIELYKSLT